MHNSYNLFTKTCVTKLKNNLSFFYHHRCTSSSQILLTNCSNTCPNKLLVHCNKNVVYNGACRYLHSKSVINFSQNDSFAENQVSNELKLRFENLTCDLLIELEKDPAIKEKIDNILKAYYLAKEKGKRVPDDLSSENLKELLHLETFSQKLKYFKFLFKKEKLKLSAVAKREKRKEEKKIRSEEIASHIQTDHIKYGLGNNSLILNVRKKSLRQFYDKRLANAVLFGQKIVIDLDYDEYMSRKERQHCASQISLLYGYNRINHNPFDMYLCNAKSSHQCVKFLRQAMPLIDEQESLVSLTDRSYLQIFPKETLVYLSPHATETLKHYDHSAVYIIGGFVDTVQRKHISLEKAEKEGIKSFSLPLDEHIVWGNACKSLSINQVFEIMLELKNTGNWKQAFSFVPKRKIKRFDTSDLSDDVLPDKIFLMDTSKNKS